ncbi:MULTISPECIES: DUF2087 domain-containing protein [Streptomyces]|uniref:DUF2087 domain-containing protein n=1 Tax=Streptomyces albus (strain ATCC 21838 / DSM 41398 / FERM P-419 / JCM 4703 / NBRC 107858) TaxID=1081613 RepID=A0A0B5EX31_STRA4|nr:DUF2087 domain-containing protein [Streptomyces sp. SCSIO ZS0520]AJE86339.1 hypothetical protein SLNWT_5963 [Streptomyces albus]AOU80642.1 hypothetical protein SLNHY_5951 [Streptomyces albus]AYN36351.1 DUF2087 domain-containing protein [Streptomyces albus]
MDHLLAALADPERQRLYARIVLGQLAPREVEQVRRPLARLLQSGLVQRQEDGSLTADPEVFRRARPAEPRPEVPRALVGFFARGRLTAIPVRPAVRHELLVHLTAKYFAADRSYTEREINEAFAEVHDDTAALRRHCVIEGLLVRERDGSRYRLAEAA